MDFQMIYARLRDVMGEVQGELDGANSDERILLSQIEDDIVALKRKVRGYDLYKKNPKTK